MQRNTLLDYFDPLQNKNHPHFFQLTHWKDYLSKIKFDDLYAEQAMATINKTVPSQVAQDKGWLEFCRTYNICKDHNAKTYIFSPYLTNILHHTSLTDLTYEDIPDEFYGYIELPSLKDEYGQEIIGIFVSIFKDSKISGRPLSDEKLIKIIAITCEGKIPEEFSKGHVIKFPDGFNPRKAKLIAVNWMFIGINPGQTFDYAIKNVKITNNFTYLTENPTPIHDTVWKHTILSALIFIQHCRQDTVLRFNEFAIKKSKAEVEKNLYTEKEFFYCDIKTHIEYKVDSTFVRGHWKFTRYGKNRQFKKLTYTVPHKRIYNKRSIKCKNENSMQDKLSEDLQF